MSIQKCAIAAAVMAAFTVSAAAAPVEVIVDDNLSLRAGVQVSDHQKQKDMTVTTTVKEGLVRIKKNIIGIYGVTGGQLSATGLTTVRVDASPASDESVIGAFGVLFEKDAEATFDTLDIAITAKNRFAQGLALHTQGTIAVNDDATIVVNSANQGIGVSVQADKKSPAEITLNGAVNKIDVTSLTAQDGELARAFGVRSSANTGVLTINGDELLINANARDDAVGLLAQYRGTVNVNAKETVLNVTGENKVAAIESRYYTNGFGTINITGNVTANATSATGQALAISAEGGTITLGGQSNVLNGDVLVGEKGLLVFENGQTVLNGDLLLNQKPEPKVMLFSAPVPTPLASQMDLKGAQLQVNGQVNGEAANVSLEGGSNLQLSQGGSIGQLYADNSTLSMGGATSIGALAGEQPTLQITDTKATVDIATNEATDVQLTATGNVTDALGGDTQKLKSQINGIDKLSGVTMAQGEVVGQVTEDAQGNKTEAVNTKNQAKQEMLLQAPSVITRVMMNDVRKRMGDLRAGEGQSGVWARYNGGKLTGEGQLSSDFHMIQAGIDTMPTSDSARFGLALSYAQADTENMSTTADMDAFSLAGYGVWMNDNGLFADVIARMAKVDTDLTAGLDAAKIDNLMLGVSGELGWRFNVTEQLYVEPSAELAYTYTDAETFKMGALTHKLGSSESLQARVGAAAGLKCPGDFGDVYVRVAGVHEFMGDSSFVTDNGTVSRTVESDGKDTWVEYAVGANINFNKATYMYVDLERTSGAKLDEDWRANVGVRYSF